MASIIWKRLPPGDLAAFRDHLQGLAPRERPVFGLLGVEASWWTALGGPARPFVVLFRGDRMVLSKLSWGRREAVSRRQCAPSSLQRVKVRRGLLLESVRLWFADGYTVRVGSLPRGQSRPVEAFLTKGPDALDPDKLTPEQLTNTWLACRALGLPVGDGPDPSPPPSPGRDGR